MANSKSFPRLPRSRLFHGPPPIVSELPPGSGTVKHCEVARDSKCCRQDSMVCRASARLVNQYSFKQVSRKRALKLSTKAFWIGLPGSMNRNCTPVRSDHKNMALPVSSGPLSTTISSGKREQLSKKERQTKTGNGEIHDLSFALPGVVIDDIEHSEPSAVGQRIAPEIHRPAPVRPSRLLPSKSSLSREVPRVP